MVGVGLGTLLTHTHTHTHIYIYIYIYIYKGGGGADAPDRLFMKGIRLIVSQKKKKKKKNLPPDLLCLRSFKFKYNSSITKLLACFLFVLFFFLPHFDQNK